MTSVIEGIGVIIPVRNEEALLADALAAVTVARRRISETLGPVAPWVRIIVVLDSCTDGSPTIAKGCNGVETISVAYRAVGAARRHGIQHLLDNSATAERSLWIANTDADSRVPADWLCRQWELATAGAELMLGTVHPDFADLSESQRRRWFRSYPQGSAHGHIHGANLGFRADRYQEAGGFQPVLEHEDVLLVQSLVAAGARVIATDTCSVLTSGRAYGRTPGGYAAHVRERL